MWNIVFEGSDDEVALIVNSHCKALTKSLISFERTDVFVSMNGSLLVIVWNLESYKAYVKQNQNLSKISYHSSRLLHSSTAASKGSKNHVRKENNFPSLFHSASILSYTLLADFSDLFCLARRCTDSGSDCKGNQLFIRSSS